MTNTDRQGWQGALLSGSNRAVEEAENPSADFLLLVDEDQEQAVCCGNTPCMRTKLRRITSGVALLALSLGLATLMYFVLVTRYPTVTSAQPTSFLYDPLELRLIGNHQMFYVENKNWLSSMSIRKISISALYTDSDGHITSLGSSHPNSTATIVVGAGSRAKIVVDLVLNVYSYPAWEEISWLCFNGKQMQLEFVAVMNVKLSNRGGFENLQFGPMRSVHICRVSVN